MQLGESKMLKKSHLNDRVVSMELIFETGSLDLSKHTT